MPETGGDPSEVYKVVIEGAPAMLWLGDAVGKCVFLNKAQRDFWGVEIEEVATFDWLSTVSPDDIGPLVAQFEGAMRDQSPFTVEARYRRADGAFRILRTEARPRFDASGEFSGMIGVNIDVTEQRRNERDLRETRDTLALATSASRLGWVQWTYATGKVTWDDRGREIFGLGEEMDTIEDWMSRISPDDRSALSAEIRASAASGRPFDFTYGIVRPDGAVRRVHGTGTAHVGQDKELLGGTGLVRDVTEQWKETEFQSLLIGELNHRIKNVLAVMRSLISQTETEGRTAKEFQTQIVGRMHALSVGLATLNTASNRMDIRDLIEAVLGPFRDEKSASIDLNGPSADLPSQAGRAIALALHELATNAVKYGALSTRDGKVRVTWGVGGDGENRTLDLSWTESGGPPVKTPAKQGFGTRLLDSVTALEIDGEAHLAFHPTGVCYSLKVCAR